MEPSLQHRLSRTVREICRHAEGNIIRAIIMFFNEELIRSDQQSFESL